MEEHRTRVRDERSAKCSNESQREAVLAEPVFCFETACKALYWSMLVYRLQVCLPTTHKHLPELRLSRMCCSKTLPVLRIILMYSIAVTMQDGGCKLSGHGQWQNTCV